MSDPIMRLLFRLAPTPLLALILLAIPAASLAQPAPYLPQDEKLIHPHQQRLSALSARLQQYPLTDNQKLYDAQYYRLDLRIDPDSQTIVGQVDIVGRALAAPLTALDFDFYHDLTVDSLRTAGATTTFTFTDDILTVDYPGLQPGAEFAVTVFYHGNPGNQGFGSFTFARYQDIFVISSLSEPFFARTWWPCKDHPSDKADSVDVIVTIDNYLTVVSNGSLRSIVDNGDGTSTTHWHESYPITTYLVSLAISDYAHYADTLHYQGKTMPVEFYLFPEEIDNYRTTNALVVPMIEFFSSIYGEYPFINEKYGHAQFLWGGGMEHQTCSSMGGFHDWLIAHELAHQWWGDMITCGTWHDIWLNEGFARYSEALWIEHTLGWPAIRNYMSHLVNLDLQVYVEDTSVVGYIFDRVVYDKGAFVLHTLRYLTGDSTFFAILRAYGESAHKYGSATTEDFRVIAESVSGRDLRRYFDQWVYQPVIPSFEYGYTTYQADSGWVTQLELRQMQGEPVFATDLDVAFVLADTTIVERIATDSPRQFYRFLLPGRPDACNLDPENWVINFAWQSDFGLTAIDDTLPEAFRGEFYSYQLSAAGGKPPVSWTPYIVTLPEGLDLSDDGLLAGFPTTAGDFDIGVRLIDFGQPQATSSTLLHLRVNRLHGDLDDQPGPNLNDALLLIRYLYRGYSITPDPALADANCDGTANAVDIVVLLNYLYRDGPRPCYSIP